MKISFPTDSISIEERIQSFDPITYGKTRNYIDGGISYLSPYISRGFLSTKRIYQHILTLNVKPYQVMKFIQELAWRDYFQLVWRELKEDLEHDIKHCQLDVRHDSIPIAVLQESLATGIHGIDKELRDFYENGYLHNHVRMYLASIICNVGKTHWKCPSEWMYYYLLDADFASNTCSWQWVAGTFSSKKYIANQENINRYLKIEEFNTYLDSSYEDIAKFKEIPKELEKHVFWDKEWAFNTVKDWFYDKRKSFAGDLQNNVFFDSYEELKLSPNKPLLIYDFYNIDPNWHSNKSANRVYLLRPSFFKKYPSSPKTLNFIYELSKNIPDLLFFWGEWTDISAFNRYSDQKIYWKEHPTNIYFDGVEEPREWMFPEVKGYYPSFFSYWKKCEKYLGFIIQDIESGLFDSNLN